MLKIPLKEIPSMDSSALAAIIEYWEVYDPYPVLLSYAELRKRNYTFSDRLIQRQSEFCAKFNLQNIDTFLTTYLKENGYNSYDELYEKEKKLKLEQDLSQKQDGHTRVRKYPVLRTINIIYKVFAVVIGIVTFIVSVVFIDKGESGLIFALISIVVGVLIILGVLAVAELIMVIIDIEHNTRKEKE